MAKIGWLLSLIEALIISASFTDLSISTDPTTMESSTQTSSSKTAATYPYTRN
jgi:hypothetical protein